MRPHYSITSQPETEPVTFSQMMAHSRVDSDDELDLLQSYISVAREYVDSVTGRVSVAHAWLLAAATWADLFESVSVDTARIYRAPLVSVESVSYYAEGNTVLTVMAPADYIVVTSYEPGLIKFLGTLPELADRPDAIQIEFTAGHTVAPSVHTHAIKMMAAHLYDHRLPIAFASCNEIPFSLRTLIENQKIAGWSA